MDRRAFVAGGAAGMAAAALTPRAAIGLDIDAPEWDPDAANVPTPQEIRQLFPRLQRDLFMDAAGGTPLGQFAVQGLDRYRDYWRWGRTDGDQDYVFQMFDDVGGLFASMIGAKPGEIALVHSTKAGEQVVLDGLPALRDGGRVVTNDLAFTGTLHNLIGRQRAGLDVEIVRSRNWSVDPQSMIDAIDGDTDLVCVSLVSNVNGHIEGMRAISDAAHAHGALVYADVIQAAGVVPFDVVELGIDFAASNGYKWLFGPHGAGFLYVREDLQGSRLPDYRYPGSSRPNYAPWVDEPNAGEPDFSYRPPTNANRYQPGHVSYLGYSALYEGLRFLNRVGVERCLAHSLELVARLRDGIDSDRFELISPHTDRSPIVTFRTENARRLEPALRKARAGISVSANRIRISPAIYNTEDDVDRLLDVLNTD